MIRFPNAKINLGLAITGKRADGFHDLESVFYPVNLTDALEVSTSESGETTLHVYGDSDTGAAHKNLAYKAYAALKKDFPFLPPVDISLLKQIPSGGGLGGGSSDASCMLEMLNASFALDISHEKLREYALALGSDCPFFLLNKPALATGRGEHLEKTAVDLSSYKILLVCPRIHVSTAVAFSGISESQYSKSGSVRTAIKLPVEKWRDHLKNDFEPSVFGKYPVLEEIKSELYRAGVVYASMSGSGSVIFGLFNRTDSPKFSFPDEYKIYVI